jgi:hypothetical protein
MSLTLHIDNTNDTCPFSLLWNQPLVNSQRPILYVCIIATFTHVLFWLQFIFYSSIRQKTMQWLYAYLLTDILLLIRFFFLFIVHTTSTECQPNTAWFLFVCSIEAVVDNYLNALEPYILLALNLCRYAQITRRKNVYITNVRLLTFAHLAIYLVPLILLIIQLFTGWAQLEDYVGDVCDVSYTNIYAQIFNTFISFIVPISLNILVVYASIHHVHLTSNLRQGQHHVSAREKYNRSLVIQFLVFYTIWLLLWSPNIIIYQFTSGTSTLIMVGRLLNFIEIALDPIIIAALDVRFYHVWKKILVKVRNEILRKFQREQRRIGPTTITTTLPTVQQRHIMSL